MNNSQSALPAKNVVEPISDLSDLDKIRGLIGDRPRDFLLFELAIATGLQAKLLLQLKVGDIKSLLKNNWKGNPLPKHTRVAIDIFLEGFSSSDDDYIFRSRKGRDPLTVASASRLVNGWFDQAGLTGLRGLLSLRKTFEFHFAPSTKTQEVNSNRPRPESEKEENFKPIRTLTLNEMVFKELERRIVLGQILPGTRLVTDRLAKKMEVSTVPVREALVRLEAKDFVTRTPQKGFIVNKRSIKSILELLELRLVIESAALKKSVPKIRPETVILLEEANELYISAGKIWNVDDMLKAAWTFHDLLLRDAGLTVFKKMIDQAWDGINPYYHIMLKQQKEPRHFGAPYHQKMIEGIKAGDTAKVIEHLTADMKKAMVYVSETLSSLGLAD